ncbi:MAG: hypothetical protein Fur005_14250 [Roseiflexaceae bacterium]
MLETRTTPIVTETTQPAVRPLVRLLLEWRIVAFMIVAILLVTAIPYAYAATTVPEGKYYTGLMLGVPDHLQYFAWMRDLAEQPLAANRLTPEANDPAFFNLLWWMVGRFAAATGMELPLLYALLRVCAVALCLSTGYAFFSVTIPNMKLRRLAFIIFSISGGLGIIWVIAKYALNLPEVPFPDDVYTSEANTFFMSLSFPHFTLASALLTGIFALMIYAMKTRQYRYAVGAGVVSIILGMQHTYDLITVYGVLCLFGALRWMRDRRFPTFLFACGLIVVALSAPPAFYMFLLVKLNPIWGEVLAQFDNAGVFTPPIYRLFILLGIPFILALIAFRPKMLQSKSDAELFVASWFVAHFALVYIPTDFQIHMLLGWQVPIAVLAAIALSTIIAPWLHKRLKLSPTLTSAAVGLIVLSTLATNAYLLGWRVLDMSRYENPYFLTSNEVAVLDWLEQNTTRNDVVMATLEIGQFVPMWSDSRAFVAHWANTLDYFRKVELARQVMDPAMPVAERDALLDQFAITYLIYEGSDPAVWAAAPRYSEVFRSGDAVIYRVNR